MKSRPHQKAAIRAPHLKQRAKGLTDIGPAIYPDPDHLAVVGMRQRREQQRHGREEKKAASHQAIIENIPAQVNPLAGPGFALSAFPGPQQRYRFGLRRQFSEVSRMNAVEIEEAGEEIGPALPVLNRFAVCNLRATLNRT